jgi:hypothetical protein
VSQATQATRTVQPVVADLSIEINGRRYGLSIHHDGWLLHKADGTVYQVGHGPHGLECDCPDYTRRWAGIVGACCKHIAAIRSTRLLAPGDEMPKRERYAFAETAP